MLGAVDDFLAIVGPEGAAVVTQLASELLDVGAVGIHGVDVEIAIAGGSEHDVLAVPGDGGLGVVAVRAGKLLHIAAIWLGRIDLIAIVNRPDVAMGVIRLRRSEEHTSELQSPIDISYAVFCLTKKKERELSAYAWPTVSALYHH